MCWDVGVMEFGLKATSRVCRGRHGEVGIVKFGHNEPSELSQWLCHDDGTIKLLLLSLGFYGHSRVLKQSRKVIFIGSQK